MYKENRRKGCIALVCNVSNQGGVFRILLMGMIRRRRHSRIGRQPSSRRPAYSNPPRRFGTKRLRRLNACGSTIETPDHSKLGQGPTPHGKDQERLQKPYDTFAPATFQGCCTVESIRYQVAIAGRIRRSALTESKDRSDCSLADHSLLSSISLLFFVLDWRNARPDQRGTADQGLARSGLYRCAKG